LHKNQGVITPLGVWINPWTTVALTGVNVLHMLSNFVSLTVCDLDPLRLWALDRVCNTVDIYTVS